MKKKTKYNSSELAALPEFNHEAGIRTAIAQNLEVLSQHGNRIRVIGSVPGAVGFSPDGSVLFEYTSASHYNHEVDDETIVNLNHHQDEVIGIIASSEVDVDGNLIIDMEISEKYSFFVPIIRDNLHDGVSIEAIITAGRMLSDTHVLVTNYILTGIAVLFTKPPACDKDICHVLSSANGDDSAMDNISKQHLEVHDHMFTLSGKDEAELRNILSEIDSEFARREALSNANDDNETANTTEMSD